MGAKCPWNFHQSMMLFCSESASVSYTYLIYNIISLVSFGYNFCFSKLCSGLNSEANYVYKVTLPGGCKMSLEFPSVYDVILFRVCFCKLYISYLQYYFFSFFRVQLLLFCCITIRDDRVKYSKLHYFAVLVTLKTILFTYLKKISNLWFSLSSS